MEPEAESPLEVMLRFKLYHKTMDILEAEGAIIHKQRIDHLRVVNDRLTRQLDKRLTPWGLGYS